MEYLWTLNVRENYNLYFSELNIYVCLVIKTNVKWLSNSYLDWIFREFLFQNCKVSCPYYLRDTVQRKQPINYHIYNENNKNKNFITVGLKFILKR